MTCHCGFPCYELSYSEVSITHSQLPSKNTLESYNSQSLKHVLLRGLVFSHSSSRKEWSFCPMYPWCIHYPPTSHSAVILVNKTPGQLFLCPGTSVKTPLFYMIMAPKHCDSNSKGAARSLSVRGNTNSDPMGQHYRVYRAGHIQVYRELNTVRFQASPKGLGTCSSWIRGCYCTVKTSFKACVWLPGYT